MPFFYLGAASVNAYWNNNPTNLDLQNTAGIEAALPSNTNLRLQLSTDAGNDYGLFSLLGTLGTFSCGLAIVGGTEVAVLNFVANSGNLAHSLSVTDTSVNSTVTDVGVKASEISHDGTNIREDVSDLAAGDSIQRNKTATEDLSTVEFAGVDIFKSRLTATGIEFLNGAGNTLFQIKPNGHILTNQAQAPGEHATLVKEVPLYDANDNLVGYIPIFT